MYKYFLHDIEELRFQKTSEKDTNTYWMVGILNFSKKMNKFILSKMLKKHELTREAFLINFEPTMF